MSIRRRSQPALMTAKSSRRNVWLIYLFGFCYSFSLVASVWTLFYFQRGFTLQDLMIFEVIYSAAMVIFELPSGLLADRWGRRKTLILGCVLLALRTVGLVVWGWSFLAVALLWFIEGFTKTLFTDTIMSLAYDSLPPTRERDKKFCQLQARFNFIDLVSYGLGAVLGSILVINVGYNLLYLSKALMLVISVIILWQMKEPKKVSPKQASLRGVKATLGKSLRLVKCSPILLHLIYFGAVMAVVNDFFWNYYQPFIEQIGLPVYYFGLVTLVISLAETIPQFFSFRFIKKDKYDAFFFGLVILTGVAALVAGLMPNKIGLVAIIALMILTGLSFPIQENYFQKAITTDCRTTTKSLQSLFSKIIGILVTVTASRIVGDQNNITLAFCLIGGLTLAYGLFYLIGNYRRIFDLVPEPRRKIKC